MTQVSLKEIIEGIKDSYGDEVNEVEISTTIKIKLRDRYVEETLTK